MELSVNISILFSIGTMIVSIASAFAVVKTKVARMEEELNNYKRLVEELREELNHNREDERVRIALLESNQEAHARELAEVKSDIKTIMGNVQEIKEAVITKGAK